MKIRELKQWADAHEPGESLEIEHLQAAVAADVEELKEYLGPTLAQMELTLRVPNGSQIEMVHFVALPLQDEPDKDSQQMRLFVGIGLNPPTPLVPVRDNIVEEDTK